MTKNENVTVWGAQSLVEMSKAQLTVIWGNQPRETFTDCTPPKSKAGYLRSILFFQKNRMAK